MGCNSANDLRKGCMGLLSSHSAYFNGRVFGHLLYWRLLFNGAWKLGGDNEITLDFVIGGFLWIGGIISFPHSSHGYYQLPS